MNDGLAPFAWAAITFLALLLLNRWIHAHLHGVSLLLTGTPQRAVVIYAIVLLPGVLLHELSHWITARLLGVRTGAFSLIPRRHPDGSVELGYVEYYKGRSLGPLRESLIGGAPLLAGTAVILLIGWRVLGVGNLATAVQSGDVDLITLALGELFGARDVWLWVYLLFAISNAMLPSASDRRAWPAFLLIAGGLALLVYLLNLGAVVRDGLAQPAAIAFGYLGTAFSIAIVVNLFGMLLLALFEGLVSRLKGVRVVYSSNE
jgi:hypothetical protein